MIRVAVGGGLGNQLFQYAMGRALSLRLGTELQLDPLELLDPMGRRMAVKRHYDLPTVFNVDPALVPPARLFRAVKVPYLPAVIGKLYGKTGGTLGLWKFITQKNGFIAFDPEVFNAHGELYFHGGWQSERYFVDHADQIRKDLTFRHPMIGEAADMRRDIENSKSVAMFVRRGDKLWNPAALKFTIVSSQDYFNGGLALLKKKAGNNVKAFIFSDEIEWCREHFKVDAEQVFVPINGPRFAWNLELMSLCKYHITPESTFSWWAAWLCKNPDKIIVAPKKMFKDETIDTRDAYPEGWIRI